MLSNGHFSEVALQHPDMSRMLAVGRKCRYPQAGSGYLFMRKQLGQDIAENFKRPDPRSVIVHHTG